MERFLATDGWCVDCKKWAALRLDSDIIAQYTPSSHIPLSPLNSANCLFCYQAEQEGDTI